MPEDGIFTGVGFGFFNQQLDPDLWIADGHAVEATDVGERGSPLSNSTAFDAAFEHLDRATSAVQEAARKSNFRFSDGSDFSLT